MWTPSAIKAGKLYSVLPSDGTGDFTVDRNSTATYVGQDGLIKTALTNVPRIDWSTGVPVILRELQSTNKFLNSEPTSAEGINSNVIYESYNWDNGFTNCIRFLGNNPEKFHYGGSYSTGDIVSIYVEMDDGSEPIIKGFSAGDFAITVNSNVGSVINKENIIGNIWRISAIATTSTSPVAAYNGVYKRTTSSTKSFRVTGFQIEQGSTASSYIPASGTTVTRLADNISVPTPAGVISITETIDGVEQAPITTIPATYSLPVGNINKVTML